MKTRLLTALFSLFWAAAALAANPMVEMKTNMGNVTLELYPDKAPKTVENFLGYVKSGFYAGTQFHRVIDSFMIQGGGFDAQFREKPTRPPVQNEAGNGLKNELYTLAMARTNDPNSATAQFFINVKDNDFLNRPSPDGYGYAVFGKVVKGQEIVMKIAKVRTGGKGPFPTDVPQQPVMIESMKLLP